ncbi:MAG: Fic family protein [Candidatus Woesearchaeota archaeon]
MNNLEKQIDNFKYLYDFFDDYDKDHINDENSTIKDDYETLKINEVRNLIQKLKNRYKACDNFGKEKDDTLNSTLNQINQSFFGKRIYNSLEQRAANLLYMLVKNHHFIDGNKRISAFLFLYFLQKNNFLYYKNKKIIGHKTLLLLILWISETTNKKRNIINVIIKMLKSY